MEALTFFVFALAGISFFSGFPDALERAASNTEDAAAFLLKLLGLICLGGGGAGGGGGGFLPLGGAGGGTEGFLLKPLGRIFRAGGAGGLSLF